MAGKRSNRLGRVYEPGKALSEPLREEIIEMYNEGLSLTDISNDGKVTVRVSPPVGLQKRPLN